MLFCWSRACPSLSPGVPDRASTPRQVLQCRPCGHLSDQSCTLEQCTSTQATAEHTGWKYVRSSPVLATPSRTCPAAGKGTEADEKPFLCRCAAWIMLATAEEPCTEGAHCSWPAQSAFRASACSAGPLWAKCSRAGSAESIATEGYHCHHVHSRSNFLTCHALQCSSFAVRPPSQSPAAPDMSLNAGRADIGGARRIAGRCCAGE